MITAFQDHYPDDVAQCYGCGRLNETGHHLRTTWEEGATGERTVTRYTPRPEYTAVPGYVYGGLVASLIDCAGTGSAAGAGYHATGRTMGEASDTAPPLRYVTGRLEVDYLAPTPMGVELVIRGHIDEVAAKKVIVSVEVQAGDTTVARGRVIAVRMPETMGG